MSLSRIGMEIVKHLKSIFDLGTIAGLGAEQIHPTLQDRWQRHYQWSQVMPFASTNPRQVKLKDSDHGIVTFTE